MDKRKLYSILNMVSQGSLDPSAAIEQLQLMPYEDLGFAKTDLHRGLRQGMPEVIFCPGKTAEQIAAIASNLQKHHSLVLASRATTEQAREVLLRTEGGNYYESARMLVFGSLPEPDTGLSPVAVITAGTADLPVADECALVLQAAAVPVLRISDVGVAGIHRLFGNLETIKSAAISIVVAGMDGALPSVVAGLLEGPVIAVPTSVGYGANFDGVSPLLSMLNSCAAGLTVVNIDNGFGAAMAAIRMVSLVSQIRSVESR